MCGMRLRAGLRMLELRRVYTSQHRWQLALRQLRNLAVFARRPARTLGERT